METVGITKVSPQRFCHKGLATSLSNFKQVALTVSELVF